MELGNALLVTDNLIFSCTVPRPHHHPTFHIGGYAWFTVFASMFCIFFSFVIFAAFALPVHTL